MRINRADGPGQAGAAGTAGLADHVAVVEPGADEAAVDAVLTASRTMVAVATMSLGTAAEETTIAQYRALVVLASRGPQRLVDLAGDLPMVALDLVPLSAAAQAA